jgi:hypothetical protein
MRFHIIWRPSIGVQDATWEQRICYGIQHALSVLHSVEGEEVGKENPWRWVHLGHLTVCCALDVRVADFGRSSSPRLTCSARCCVLRLLAPDAIDLRTLAPAEYNAPPHPIAT